MKLSLCSSNTSEVDVHFLEEHHAQEEVLEMVTLIASDFSDDVWAERVNGQIKEEAEPEKLRCKLQDVAFTHHSVPTGKDEELEEEEGWWCDSLEKLVDLDVDIFS